MSARDPSSTTDPSPTHFGHQPPNVHSLQRKWKYDDDALLSVFANPLVMRGRNNSGGLFHLNLKSWSLILIPITRGQSEGVYCQPPHDLTNYGFPVVIIIISIPSISPSWCTICLYCFQRLLLYLNNLFTFWRALSSPTTPYQALTIYTIKPKLSNEKSESDVNKCPQTASLSPRPTWPLSLSHSYQLPVFATLNKSYWQPN